MIVVDVGIDTLPAGLKDKLDHLKVGELAKQPERPVLPLEPFAFVRRCEVRLHSGIISDLVVHAQPRPSVGLLETGGSEEGPSRLAVRLRYPQRPSRKLRSSFRNTGPGERWLASWCRCLYEHRRRRCYSGPRKGGAVSESLYTTLPSDSPRSLSKIRSSPNSKLLCGRSASCCRACSSRYGYAPLSIWRVSCSTTALSTGTA